MPWHRGSGGHHPVNVASGNRYRGVNVLGLWVEAQVNGFGSHLWGTFRQWSEKGATVRKGQKASYVVFYKEIDLEPEASAENEPKRRLFARATAVFNADQVDGHSTPDTGLTVALAQDVDEFVAATGAKVIHGGSRACYIPGRDEIHMPERSLFTGSPTSTPTEAYYSTLLHQLTHWTAPGNRCDRNSPAVSAAKRMPWKSWSPSWAPHSSARSSP
jgi:antirestriction protein ArdC